MKKDIQTSSQPQRRGELDVIGMLIVVGLIFFHTAQIFYSDEFFIKNEPPSIAALFFLSFASLWGMPLMFLIAGMSIRHSLLKRTAGEFLLERVKRLLIPFITGILIILPPQVYYGLKTNPAYFDSYFQFYPRFFNVRLAVNFPLYIKGAPPDELFQISYLYFLIYLLAFTVILLPFFNYLRKVTGRRLLDRLAFFSKSWAIFLLAFPIAVIEAALRTEMPGAWNRYAWICFIVYGFLVASDKELERALREHRKRALLLGIITLIFYFAGGAVAFDIVQVDPWTDYGLTGLLIRFVKGLTSWCWVVAIMGFAVHISQKRARKKHLTDSIRGASHSINSIQNITPKKPSFMARVAGYVKGAQLPFYVLHQLPIVVIGFYVVQWEVYALVKYIVISLGSLVSTLVLYDIFVRRTILTRFIFGVRPRKEV